MLFTKSLFLLFLFPLFTQLPPSNPISTSTTYIIGYSTSPTSLAQFLRQFPGSAPPPDVCIIFLTPSDPQYANFRAYNLHLLPPPATLHTAYQLALPAATSVILADDATFFHTTRYGTGKSDVQLMDTSFDSLLPSPDVVKVAPLGVSNSAAILTDTAILERTLPLSHLHHTGGRPDTTFETLQNISGNPQYSITTLLPFTPDVRPLHRALQPRFPLSMVNAPDHEPAADALYHPPGAFGRLAKPALYQRQATWLLPFDDTISGYIAQRALWENGSGVLVAPGLDVWQTGGVSDAGDVEDKLERVVNYLQKVEIPGRFKFIDEVYQYLVKELVKLDLIAKEVLVNVREFHYRLRRQRVARLLRRHYERLAEDEVDTAVCVTGQMRSAAFTSRNILETLREGVVGGFDVFVVTERDDRSGASRLFQATTVRYSSEPEKLEEWVRMVRRSTIVHETMMTERQIRNYVRQLWDMRECERMVREHELRLGRRYSWMVRMRPDVVFTKPVSSRWWTGRSARKGGSRVVVYGKRQSYYSLNDRFFAGERSVMGRLMTCHDVFGWVIKTGSVYSRKAGDRTHMLFKKLVNSERFLGRCAALKRVATKGIDGIEVRRVALSGGVARWREF